MADPGFRDALRALQYTPVFNREFELKFKFITSRGAWFNTPSSMILYLQKESDARLDSLSHHFPCCTSFEYQSFGLIFKTK
jgi:hypothetical protein